jgi:hypothetical protein
VTLLLLNGGNPLDEFLMIGVAILIAYLIVRFTTRGGPDEDQDEGEAGGEDPPAS